MGVDGTDICCC